MVIHKRAEKYANTGLKVGDASRILTALKQLMKEQKTFLDTDITIDKLAGLVNTNRHCLSQVKEWFLDLVEKIIFYEYGNYLALNGIRSVRLETRKEILRRLNTAKQYMDDAFLAINEINQVAAVCNMSEFHFFRSFKQAFNITPYQYLLNKRLHLAKELIKAGDMSVTHIAVHCNFPDLFTFSKAFKRQFNIAPSRLPAVDR